MFHVIGVFRADTWSDETLGCHYAAAGGRLCLGIGLSHQIVVESMWGLSFAKPVRHLREYLSVLGPLSRGEAWTR